VKSRFQIFSISAKMTLKLFENEQKIELKREKEMSENAPVSIEKDTVSE
jgi:hypothetical protein